MQNAETVNKTLTFRQWPHWENYSL